VSIEKVREFTGQQLLGHHPRATIEMVWTRLEDENRHSCKAGDLLVSN